MIVGFTGTRKGMTPQQRATCLRLLANWMPEEAHHGDCVGADADFASLVSALGVVPDVHPPSDPKLRAWTDGKVHEPLPYLVRNKKIVDAVARMLAAPGEFVEQDRSGTWSTIRYAEKRGVPVWVVLPDGRFHER